MNKLRQSLFLVGFIFSATHIAYAEEPNNFKLNPTTLKTRLFEKNASLLMSLQNIQTSKLNVNKARANLFPSIGLSFLLPVFGVQNFLLSSVTHLLPFLIPANWAVVDQQKAQLESDKLSYQILELNLLSSALSLYYTAINDQKILNIFKLKTELSLKKLKSLKHEQALFDNISPSVLDSANNDFLNLKMQAGKIQLVVDDEMSNLKSILRLPVDTILILEELSPLISGLLFEDPQEVVNSIINNSPEMIQNNLLIANSKNQSFMKNFAFINNAYAYGSNSDNIFKDLKAVGSFNFGLDFVVNKQIAANNTNMLLLRKEQVIEDLTNTTRSILRSLNEQKAQYESSLAIFNSKKSLYKNIRKQFAFGTIFQTEFDNATINYYDSFLSLYKAELDYRLQIVAFNRNVNDVEFKEINTCKLNIQNIEEKKSSAWFDEITDYFKQAKTYSLDDYCRQ